MVSAEVTIGAFSATVLHLNGQLRYLLFIHLDVARVFSSSPPTPRICPNHSSLYGLIICLSRTLPELLRAGRAQVLKATCICSNHSLHSQRPEDYVNTIEELGVLSSVVDRPSPWHPIRLAVYACQVAVVIVKAFDYKSRIALGQKLEVWRRNSTNKCVCRTHAWPPDANGCRNYRACVKT